MQRIVVAAKAGSEQPWLAQAAAELAGQSKAVVEVVSADGLEMEAFSTVPRVEAARPAEQAAKAMAEQIVELVNIGTLFAFVVVNIGVIILRRTRPDLPRGYRVPFVPIFPIIGTLLCVYLMADLPRTTWARFAIWMAIGFVIYFLYGIRHSRLRRGQVENPEAQL